jgi:hypothetical protein
VAALTVGIVLLAGACENRDASLFPDPFKPGGSPTSVVSLRSTVQPLFTVRCAVGGCHNLSDLAGGMSLQTGHLFDPQTGAVGVSTQEVPTLGLLRVDPGHSGASYMIWKITRDPRIEGSPMPGDGSTLSGEQIDVIRRWIDQGAHDN